MRFFVATVSLFFLLFYCYACKKTAVEKTYLFLSHTYDWGAKDNNKVDVRLERMDFSPYDQLWLGGDLCARASERTATLEYLDRLFNISGPNTHWSLGNHDITRGIPGEIERICQRPSYYTRSFDGICLLVLNTTFNHPQLETPDQCEDLNRQFELLRSITDTISQSSHLIILHHHCLLTNELADGQLDMDTIFHYYRPKLDFSCQPKGSFQELAYPLLVNVQKRGVDVLLIAGDIGQRQKIFDFQTKEGIQFLGAGINNSLDAKYAPAWVTNFDPDSLIIFHHFPETKTLNWEYVLLNDLVK